MIAIHYRRGSFSERWVKYCKIKKIPYKIVNCYDSDIIEQLRDVKALMWHWNHGSYKDQLFARQLLISLEMMNIKVYPDIKTCWHFDDKIGQKYLLEAINAPLVKSYVFYDKHKAENWINTTTFPKVFKLRGGAGALNVTLVKNKSKAKKLINQAFGKGFPLINQYSALKQRFWILKRDKNYASFLHFIKGIAKLFYKSYDTKLLPRQKGYAYFQDFIPNNNFDDRIVVIGEKAIAIRRLNRTNDFKASGSGIIKYEPKLFRKKVIELSFKIAKQLSAQSIAFDYIYDKNGNPLITEISYGFSMGKAYDDCPGYWDSNLVWHNEKVDPQLFIFEDLIKTF